MKELKEFTGDTVFVELLNKAFADLRADYELDLDNRKDKINELKNIHVDHKDFLSNLTSYSTKSSGLISGLRGTGKTHLFLLARNEINNNIDTNKSFCLYLNAKRLHLPVDFSQEVFNRVFSIFLYREISKQLFNLLKDYTDNNLLDKLVNLFNKDKKRFVSGIVESIKLVKKYKEIARQGSESLTNTEKADISTELSEKEVRELSQKICSKLSLKDAALSGELNGKLQEELSSKTQVKSDTISYLNIASVRENIIDIIKCLNLKCITIYVDEWEKLFNIPKAQEYLSFYIDRINDDPIFIWIGAVPYRGKFYCLDIGADLQHKIDLDSSFIFENSKQEKEECITYFRHFIDKRLKYFLADYTVDHSTLFNSYKKLEMLMFGSMANPRDFGTTLLQCWTEYKNYRLSPKHAGRPYKYISEDMIQRAIKLDGSKKLTNIKSNSKLMMVWQDVENFALQKKSSHFAILDSINNTECLSAGHFSDLLYHRLLHYRRGHVSQKDSEHEEKLSIYALNYSCIYDHHQKEKRIIFYTDYDSIHNKVRRYIYSPTNILNKIKIKEGEIHPCVSCSENIDINKMKAAWEKNSCPYCGNKIWI